MTIQHHGTVRSKFIHPLKYNYMKFYFRTSIEILNVSMEVEICRISTFGCRKSFTSLDDCFIRTKYQTAVEGL